MLKVLKDVDALIAVGCAVIACGLLYFEAIQESLTGKLTFGLLTTISLFLVVRTLALQAKLNELQATGRRTEVLCASISASLADSSRCRILSGNDAFYETLLSLVKPNSELCATTFSDFVKVEQLPGDAVKRFFSQLDDYMVSSPDFRLWRVAYVPNLRKLRWLRTTIQVGVKCNGYHVGIVGTELTYAPAMNMSIVDRRHVILFGRHEISAEPMFIYIESEEVAAVARQLFDEWWRASMKIKEGSTVHWDKLNAIEDRLRSPAA